MKDVAALVKILNRSMPYGWGVHLLTTEEDHILQSCQGISPCAYHLVLKHALHPVPGIDLYYIERAGNSTARTLSFDWSKERKDNMVCLFWSYGSLILGVPRSVPHWPDWTESLQEAFKTDRVS